MLKAYLISNLIATLLSLSLALFVYLKNRKSTVNITFALMNLSIAIWAFGFAMAIVAPSKNWGFFWIRVLNVGCILIPMFFLHFVFSFLKIKKKEAIKLIIAYTITIFIIILSFTSLFTLDIRPKLSFNYYLVPGSLYFLYVLMLGFYISYGLYKLFKELKKTVGFYRNQIKYLIFACIIGFSGGSMIFLPVFEINVYPIGQMFFPLESFIIGYAIIKHRLMDIDFVLRKSAVYLFASSLYLIPPLLVLLITQKFVFNEINFIYSILLIMAIPLAAYVFPQLRSRAERTAEQYVFKNFHDYKSAIQELTKATVSIFDKKELCKKIVDTITQAMDVRSSSVYLLDEEQNSYLLFESTGLKNPYNTSVNYHKNHPFFSLLEQRKDIIVREEVEHAKDTSDSQAIISTMNALGAEITIPLVSKHRLLGILNLGAKGNKKMYSHEDLELLTTLAGSAAVALENAELVENINKTRIAMERADRLAQIGMVAAGIAHEIRNPMVAIKTSAQLLPERYEDKEFRSYFSSVVVSEIDRVTRKINDLLDYARPANPFFQKENINSIIDDTVALLKNEAHKKGLTIETILSPNLPQITVDKEQMKQVFINLIRNAIDATPQNGKIFINTQNQEKANGAIEFIQIQVSDTGSGIPKEDLTRIFTPFYTTKKEGSGIGLAMTQQIVVKHGGSIVVHSKVNEGTTFTVSLPVNPLLLSDNDNPHVQ